MLTFLVLLADHFYWYITCVAIAGSGLYLAFRRQIFALIDPLFFFLVINEAFCIADVLFMWKFKMADGDITLNYVLTETALLIGILQFRGASNKGPKSAVPLGKPSLTLRTLYSLSLILFIGLNLVVYLARGVPLFQKSRLAIYNVGGGWGLFARSFDVFLVIIMYYLMDIARRRSWRFSEWGTLAIVAVIEILSGAKIAVLEIFFLAGLASYFMGSERLFFSFKSRSFKFAVAISILTALGVAAIQSRNSNSDSGTVNSFGVLAYRMVSCGDAFIYSYPSRFAAHLDGSHPLEAIFEDYLSFFRIVPQEYLPVHIGIQIAQYFTGESNIQTNAKHNLFGLTYFGYWGSIVYSYLVGSAIGFVRGPFRRKLLPQNWVGAILFMMLSLGTVGMINEPDVLNWWIIGILVFLIPLIIFSNALAYSLKSLPDQNAKLLPPVQKHLES